MTITYYLYDGRDFTVEDVEDESENAWIKRVDSIENHPNSLYPMHDSGSKTVLYVRAREIAEIEVTGLER